MKTKSKLSAYILRGSTAALLFSCVIVALCSAINLPHPPKALPPRDNAAFGANAQQNRTLSFVDRVAYQRAIEEVYWRHRLWPKERPDPKPGLDAVMSQAQIEKKVTDYLRNSQALEDYWQRPLRADQLQTEMERMASHTKQPDVLRELFEALGNDPVVIAECLARPVLAERLLTERLGGSSAPSLDDKSNHEAIKNSRPSALAAIVRGAANPPDARYHLPVTARPSGGVCAGNTWTPTTLTNVPEGRATFTAVWTGSEMTVWGGENQSGFLNTGGGYNPITDSWTATTTTNVPVARRRHTAVWTGTEMIVWAGDGEGAVRLNTGGRYNPITDSWTATSTSNAPEARHFHNAVWTGTEMFVWGGEGSPPCPPPFCLLNTGGRYDPSTDSWTATSTTNAPSPRVSSSAVWTGSEIIVWGGHDGFNPVNTGGRYDPDTDSWTVTSTTNAPSARFGAGAVWTGSEMIVWSGGTGGRYDPNTDSWTATSNTNAPTGGSAAAWTGSEMIAYNAADTTGGRYDPDTDSWTATTTTEAPSPRGLHRIVWTGSEMIVWGGDGISADAGEFIDCSRCLNTGSRYCPGESGPTPTPTPRNVPIPRPRPTPPPRP